MRVGIIAEGQGDQAVIQNILCGALDIDRESIQLIRPADGKDETDLHQQKAERFGNCALVKQDCLERFKIRDFFNSPVDEGERLLVIHVDTAEIGRADAVLQAIRPAKPAHTTTPKKAKKKGAKSIEGTSPADPLYADALRDAVIAEIDAWLDGEYKSQLRYAIAIEETEAWVLALKVEDDTLEYRDPKDTLHKFLNRPNGLSKQERSQLYQLGEYERFDKLSREFRRKKPLMAAADKNRSLELFVASL